MEEEEVEEEEVGKVEVNREVEVDILLEVLPSRLMT